MQFGADEFSDDSKSEESSGLQHWEKPLNTEAFSHFLEDRENTVLDGDGESVTEEKSGHLD